jgi:3',5'-cyclic AMP phosphodiesterase CpdA
MISTEHPRPRHTFLHITDTHFPGEPGLLYGAADADAHLAQLLAAVEASGVRPDALLMAGDLTDRGDAAAYRRLRELVLPLAERIGAEVVWAPGNHDERGAFRGELLGETPAVDPICFVRWFGGMRVLVVDSTVPGEHWGALAEGQLAWLREQLATPAPEGSLIVMHHPPLPTVLDLAVTVELRDQAALAEVLRGSDVRSILSGHVHHPSFGTFAGIPVAVATSTAYSQDLAVGLGGTRGQDGAQGLNVVHVYDDTVVHSPLTIGAYPTVGEHVPAPAAAARIEAQGIRWRDA